MTKVGEFTFDFKAYYIMMKKRGQTQNSTYYVILFILNSRKTNLKRSEANGFLRSGLW